MNTLRLRDFYVISFLFHLMILFLIIIKGFESSQFTINQSSFAHVEEPTITTILIPFQEQSIGDPLPDPVQTFEERVQSNTESDTTQGQDTPPSSQMPSPQTDTERENQLFSDPINESTILEQETIQINTRSEQAKPEHIRREITEQSPQGEKTQPILSLFRGFVKSLQQGNSFMQRDGEKTIPSQEELKYLSYQQKIDEKLMSSWRSLTATRPQINRMPLSQPASVTFEIAQDGTLTFVELTSSSGDREFDQMVLRSINQATPFPPIPDHLGIKTYRPIGGTYRVSW